MRAELDGKPAIYWSNRDSSQVIAAKRKISISLQDLEPQLNSQCDEEASAEANVPEAFSKILREHWDDWSFRFDCDFCKAQPVLPHEFIIAIAELRFINAAR